MTNSFDKAVIGVAIAYILLWIAGVLGVIYVAWHFISKYW